MRYLVATDGSEESDEAVRYASKQAIATGADLEFVHVLEPEPELVDGELVLPGDDTAIEIGTDILERSQQLADEYCTEHDGDVTVETELLTGRPANEITEYARKEGVEAIYVGHRGLSSQQGTVVGSVAKSVIDKATLPVVVVR